MEAVSVTTATVAHLSLSLRRCVSFVQFETCWALTNMVCGSSAQCTQVVKAGVVPIFLKMIQDERPNFAEAKAQAVWAVRR